MHCRDVFRGACLLSTPSQLAPANYILFSMNNDWPWISPGPAPVSNNNVPHQFTYKIVYFDANEETTCWRVLRLKNIISQTKNKKNSKTTGIFSKHHFAMFHIILHYFLAKLDKVEIRQIQRFHSEATIWFNNKSGQSNKVLTHFWKWSPKSKVIV